MDTLFLPVDARYRALIDGILDVIFAGSGRVVTDRLAIIIHPEDSGAVVHTKFATDALVFVNPGCLGHGVAPFKFAGQCSSPKQLSIRNLKVGRR